MRSSLLLSPLVLESSSCDLGQFLELLLPIVEAPEMARVHRASLLLDWTVLVYQVEATNLLLSTSEDFLHVEYGEHVFKEAQLCLVVSGRVGCHTGRGIDLNEPRLQLVVQQDIEAVQLEAVLVVLDGLVD